MNVLKIFTIPEALIASDLLIKNEICLSQLILRMPLPKKGATMAYRLDAKKKEFRPN